MGRVAGALIAGMLAAWPGVASAGPLVDACRGVNQALHGPCRVVEQATSAATRPLLVKQRAAAVAAFERSWTAGALHFQHHLADDVAFVDAPWIGTHNSFNSHAQAGLTLSASDSNQQLTLADQLRLGVRSIELDLHWWPALERRGARAPVVCHGQDDHSGCTTEPTLDRQLIGVTRWLRAHPGEAFLLYLENKLDGATGEQAAVDVLQSQLGDRLYRPAGTGCSELPLTVSRADVLAAGKQVVVMGNGCSGGAPWRSVVFNGRNRVEDRPVGFAEFPACGAGITRADYARTIVRYYEDSTALTPTASLAGQATADDGITPPTAARMMRCGVDLLGLDQLLPDDGRLPALVWSWAANEPRPSGDCAVQRAGRWYATGCAAPLPAACRAADGGWSVTAPVAPASAQAACAAAGAEHAAPRTGYEAQLVRLAAPSADVLLGLRRGPGGFAALDTR